MNRALLSDIRYRKSLLIPLFIGLPRKHQILYAFMPAADETIMGEAF